MGPDLVSDRGSDRDPAVRIPVARARHAAAVCDLGLRLHHRELLLRLRLDDRADDPLARDPGIFRRRHDPDGVRVGLYGVSALEILHRRPDHRAGRDAGADHRPDGRRLSSPTRCPGTGCSSSTSCPASASPSACWCWSISISRISSCSSISTGGVCSFMAGFLGSLEYVLEEGPQYEWLQDTSVAVCAAICAVSAIAFFWRVLTAREPIVDIRAFTDRNFGDRLPDLVLHRHRPLRPDLHLSALSRRSARLQRADDRRDHVRLRHHHVPDRADRRASDDEGRHALHRSRPASSSSRSAPGR